MSEEQIKFSTSNANKLDLIFLTLQRLQEDLERISERLHGLEVSEQRQNSST